MKKKINCPYQNNVTDPADIHRAINWDKTVDLKINCKNEDTALKLIVNIYL